MTDSMLRLFCSDYSSIAPQIGDLMESASPSDPIFWPTHPTLDRMWQWRMLGPGMYVTGLEPANCDLAGRAAEREAGTLQLLEPGERQTFGVSVRVSLGAEVLALVGQG